MLDGHYTVHASTDKIRTHVHLLLRTLLASYYTYSSISPGVYSDERDKHCTYLVTHNVMKMESLIRRLHTHIHITHKLIYHNYNWLYTCPHLSQEPRWNNCECGSVSCGNTGTISPGECSPQCNRGYLCMGLHDPRETWERWCQESLMDGSNYVKYYKAHAHVQV